MDWIHLYTKAQEYGIISPLRQNLPFLSLISRILWGPYQMFHVTAINMVVYLVQLPNSRAYLSSSVPFCILSLYIFIFIFIVYFSSFISRKISLWLVFFVYCIRLEINILILIVVIDLPFTNTITTCTEICFSTNIDGNGRTRAKPWFDNLRSFTM